MSLLYIGSDHAGFGLKQLLARELATLGHEVIDMGAHSMESCDYPLVARPLCQKVIQEQARGILICGTGIGMSIAANRFPGIRAALCCNELMARMARRHNDANILCLGARVTGEELALAITVAFIEGQFEGGRHQRRIDALNMPVNG